MKKYLKNLSQVLMGILLTLGMFSPLSVLADGAYVISFVASGEHTMAIDGGHLKIDGEFVDFKNGDNNIGTLNCTDNKHCTITVNDGTPGKLRFNAQGKFDLQMQGHGFDMEHNFVNNETLSVVDPGPVDGDPNQGPGAPFDGNAVLVWSCGNKICYHEYHDLNKAGSNVIFAAAKTISDDRDPSIKFDVDAKVKFFSPTELFDTKRAEINANSVKADDLMGPDGIDYMPVNEPAENNAFVSYGNRNFKAIIYGDKFKGLKIGDFSNLTYYPGAWENVLTRRESFDVSGTTKENPVIFDTVLLESKFNLQKIDLNNFTIKSIEPLDVPEGAVTVTKRNDGSYDFEFASRYYNKVVFKLTDNENKEYFFMINRQAMSYDLRIERDATLFSELYFDRSTSWEDYIVTARYEYKDGSAKIVKLYNARNIDDGLGNNAEVYENDEENPERREWPKGKGLKRAVFKTSITMEELKTIDKIYLNVEFKGSTDKTYAGNYAGSKKGEVIDLNDQMYKERIR